MIDKEKVIFGVYKTYAEAEKAVELLKKYHFSENDISIVYPNHDNLFEALHELHVPNYEAERFENYIKNGEILVAFSTNITQRLLDAKIILEKSNVEFIVSSGEIALDQKLLDENSIERSNYARKMEDEGPLTKNEIQ